MASRFNPSPILRNAHVQALISSTPLRSWPLKRRTRKLQASAQDVVLQCSDGICLNGLYNPHSSPTRGLAILLVDEVLPHQPVRHWVLRFPFQLRFLLVSYHAYMGEVLGIVQWALSTHVIRKA